MDDNGFYVYNMYTRRFESVDSTKVTINSHPQFDFFAHKAIYNDGFNVTEAITGSAVSVAFTSKEEAIDFATHKLSKITDDEFTKLIVDKIKIYGISPRYLSKVLPC